MQRSRRTRGLEHVPLFWRVFILNAVVLLAAVVTFALSPATVSSPLLPTELVVLVVGLVVMLATNAVLLRMGLAPVERLMRTMETADLLRPGARLNERGSGDLTPLVRTFNQMLERLERERASSAAQAVSAQEGERRRIARELHDEIGQSITAVLLGLKRAADRAPEALRPDLLQVQETARQSIDDVRRIAQRLRPDLLDELGLVPALTSLVDEFADLVGVDVRPRLEAPQSPLSGEVEVVVYRVAQESLTNVARHAQAHTVDVLLTHENDALLLEVSDDGRGATRPDGAGIRGMRERALLVGATLELRSEPGCGTLVRLRVPSPGRRGGGRSDCDLGQDG